MEISIIILGVVLLALLCVFFYYVPFFLWISARVSGVRISLLQLVLMRIRKVPASVIVRAMIEAHKAGLTGVTRDDLEAHYLAGGNVEKVVHALVSASKANIDLGFKMATAIDLRPRRVSGRADERQSQGDRHAARDRRGQGRHSAHSQGPSDRAR